MAEKKKKGFASLDPERHKEIASRGGKAAHESGHAHKFTPEQAAEAGRKGGREVSRDRDHMVQIGRKGGLSSYGVLLSKPLGDESLTTCNFCRRNSKFKGKDRLVFIMPPGDSGPVICSGCVDICVREIERIRREES